MAKTPKIYKQGNHQKPTPEELDAEMKRQMEELEKLEGKPPKEESDPTPTPPADPEPEPTPEVPEEPDEEPEIPEEPEDDSDDGEPEPPQEPKKELTKEQKLEKELEETKKKLENTKKRYSDSSSEGHIMYRKNKKMSDAIKKAGEVSEPTEEELKSEYDDWDVMDDSQRRIAKDNVVNRRRLDAIQEASREFEDIDQWNQKVDDFLIDPGTTADHPQLEGKEEDFKVFVTSKQSRMGVEFEDLISAFLFEESQKPKPKKKGNMFPTGSGGDNTKPKPKSDKISISDSAILRKTNYPKYLEYLKAGKIETDVDNI